MPLAEKFMTAAVPPLAWPHRKSPAPSVRARRMTACDSGESSKSNLQGNRPPKVKNRQIRLLQHTQSSSPLKGFRIFHGRLVTGHDNYVAKIVRPFPRTSGRT